MKEFGDKATPIRRALNSSSLTGTSYYIVHTPYIGSRREGGRGGWGGPTKKKKKEGCPTICFRFQVSLFHV